MKYEVKDLGSSVPEYMRFEARTPYRRCVYIGATETKALENLITGVALLARDGALNPYGPDQPGVGVISHLLSVLTDHLARIVATRADECSAAPFSAEGGQLSERVARVSRQIAALGTAISSLSRVEAI